MAVRVAVVTVRVVVPVTEPFTALIEAIPAARDLTRPEPTVATPAFEELHVHLFVIFCVLPLSYVPVADNCTLVPSAICGSAGPMVMETSAGAATVKAVEAVAASKLAVIVAVPTVKVATAPL